MQREYIPQRFNSPPDFSALLSFILFWSEEKTFPSPVHSAGDCLNCSALRSLDVSGKFL